MIEIIPVLELLSEVDDVKKYIRRIVRNNQLNIECAINYLSEELNKKKSNDVIQSFNCNKFSQKRIPLYENNKMMSKQILLLNNSNMNNFKIENSNSKLIRGEDAIRDMHSKEIPFVFEKQNKFSSINSKKIIMNPNNPSSDLNFVTRLPTSSIEKKKENNKEKLKINISSNRAIGQSNFIELFTMKNFSKNIPDNLSCKKYGNTSKVEKQFSIKSLNNKFSLNNLIKEKFNLQKDKKLNHSNKKQKKYCHFKRSYSNSHYPSKIDFQNWENSNLKNNKLDYIPLLLRENDNNNKVSKYIINNSKNRMNTVFEIHKSLSNKMGSKQNINGKNKRYQSSSKISKVNLNELFTYKDPCLERAENSNLVAPKRPITGSPYIKKFVSYNFLKGNPGIDNFNQIKNFI